MTSAFWTILQAHARTSQSIAGLVMYTFTAAALTLADFPLY
jgi:hypothetical protein